MTFHDVCGKFKTVDGIEDAYLLLSEEDNYYISLSDFEKLFEEDFDEEHPYESLSAASDNSPAWKDIWDDIWTEDL
ncbi:MULTISPECIES: hypothetical protein [Bacillus]|uniref:hypothetical protein n=1 Tax=Bacillus TaxID=1386 RepID=UPI0013627623|nr:MULTISPECIES: hypothetical protein [Bacillus]MCX2811536.1 hypothetical protein [Bacillus sp. ChL18]MCY0091426.1 hypothetical protein [Bacillus velezensis]MCY8467235.1 hypothetical protein [Bacillus atrophaeus]MCY8476412.1 hypothetical protein [Bacillus atrophaeus]MCY8495941.1 hypothetical protein [Bacillus atrophaeus]